MVRRREQRPDGAVGAPTVLGHVSKSEAVYAEVRRMVLEGELAPGTRVNQEQLAARLGVSTTPLREALRRLETEGFVRPAAHRDVVVAPLDSAELAALYEVREDLDALAASLAAKRHTAEDRARIVAAAAQLEYARDDALAANRAFHAAIYRACNNPVLVELLDALWDRADRYRRQVGGFAAEPKVLEEHQAIVDAVLAGRARDAGRLMREHLRSAHAVIADRIPADGDSL